MLLLLFLKQELLGGVFLEEVNDLLTFVKILLTDSSSQGIYYVVV